MSPMVRLLATAAVVVAALLLLLWLFQRKLIYLPTASPVPDAAGVLEGAREVTLRTEDGLRLGAWLVTPPGPPPAAGVLVANGNAGDRSLRAPLAQALVKQGFAVLLFDYRGFGGNPGTPTESGLALDARAAHKYLVNEADLPADKLLFFGESLGAAVVAELATEHPPAGLLLRSPFVDLAAVGRVHYPILPVRLLLRDRFPVAAHVAKLDIPVTVVYGESDSIVPASQSRAVADAAPDAATVAVPGADHNDRALFDSPVIVKAIVDLARRAGLVG